MVSLALIIASASACARQEEVATKVSTNATSSTTSKSPGTGSSSPTSGQARTTATTSASKATTSTAPDKDAACAVLKPYFVVQGTSVFPAKGWYEPGMVKALSDALPAAPETPTSDGQSVRAHVQAVIDEFRDGGDLESPSRVGRSITETINWISKECYGLTGKFQPLPPGATIG